MRKTLFPFAPTPHDLQFEVDFQRAGEKLIIVYLLTGATQQIQRIDKDLCHPKRADELWRSTCFEWFLRFPDLNQYWEFNATPMGLWNFYQLDDYRTNLQPSHLVENPQFSSQKECTDSSFYQFKVEVDLQKFFPGEYPPLSCGQLAITSVIQWLNGETSYFSLRHPHAKPDFHSPEGFIISLSEEKND